MDTKVTLKNLAEILDVSVSTVSKSLNDNHEISHETRRRVKSLASAMHYIPNVLAQNLKSRKTKTIGVIIPDILPHFFAKALYGMEAKASELGYKIIISISHESLEKEKESISTLISGSVDGIIISLSRETQAKMEIEHLQEISNFNLPLVLFDRVLSIIPCDKISINDSLQAEKATIELIVSGCTKVAYLTGIKDTSVDDQRKAGYLKAIKNYGIKKQILEFTQGRFPNEKLRELIKNNKVDSILASDEIAGILAMKSIIQSGFRVPEDVSVIGFTNGQMGENFLPSLTTVDQHEEEQGRLAMETMIARLENRLGKESVEHRLQTSLIHRESTRR
jgi:LacI family transcriptional regulator